MTVRPLPHDAAEHDGATGRNLQIVSPTRFMDDLADTVRIFCKVRRVMTIEQLAVRAGIGDNRMGKLIHRDPLERRQASGSELMSIWAVLGAAGASHGLASIGMIASDDETAADDVRLGLAVAGFLEAGAGLARAAADGKFDPSEADDALRACDQADEKTADLRRAARAAKKQRR
jgi:hypothetical protein